MLTKPEARRILLVDADAGEDVVKRAYRKQALKYHPDKNSEASAKEQFQKVSEAYKCLTDPNYEAENAEDGGGFDGDIFLVMFGVSLSL